MVTNPDPGERHSKHSCGPLADHIYPCLVPNPDLPKDVCAHEKLSIRFLAKIEEKTNWKKKSIDLSFPHAIWTIFSLFTPTTTNSFLL